MSENKYFKEDWVWDVLPHIFKIVQFAVIIYSFNAEMSKYTFIVNSFKLWKCDYAHIQDKIPWVYENTNHLQQNNTCNETVH